MAELVGGRAGGEPGLVHQGGHGLAEDVGGDPVEAGGGEGVPQVGLGVGGIAPSTQGAGNTGRPARSSVVAVRRAARSRSIATHQRGSTRVPASVLVVLTTRPWPRTRTAAARTSTVPTRGRRRSRAGRRPRRCAARWPSGTRPGRAGPGRSPARRRRARPAAAAAAARSARGARSWPGRSPGPARGPGSGPARRGGRPGCTCRRAPSGTSARWPPRGCRRCRAGAGRGCRR